MTALDDIAAERQRQIDVEGWTAEHDDAHRAGELAAAAACYCARRTISYQLSGGRLHGDNDPNFAGGEPVWPWDAKWWKPTNRRRDLVKAGALIVAEIERLDRAKRLREIEILQSRFGAPEID